MNGAEVLTRFTADTSGVDKATKSTSASLGKLASAFTIGNVAATAINKTLQTFNQNLDGAITRYDTMNNFPKVMKNLGISADEATEVIQDLSDKLTGLPTSLDAGARAVQRFTSVNGDIRKSEKIFVAVNNAILAGGASADIQASALEQMAQAYSKGRPDMMEWRTLLMAMPAQLNQVAKAMGITTDALGDGLRKGGVEMDDFIDTIVKLNTTGVGEFASFEEQARGSTQGISTSITNMETATKRGIANMIGKVNEALQPFGGLSGVISNAGKTAEKVFSAIGDVLSYIIPKLIEVANWCKDNIGIIKGVAIAVGSLALAWKGIELLSFIQQSGSVVAALGRITTAIFGNIAAKVADKAETAALNVMYAKDFVKSIAKATAGLVKNTAQFVAQKGAMIATTVATKAMAAAQWLLNAAMSANPIGLIIAGIVALVAVIVLLWNKCEWFRNLVMTIFNAIKTGLQAVITFFQPVIDFVYNCFITWAAIFFTFWETIFNFLKTVGTWIYENVIVPVVNFAVGLFETIKNAFIAMWEWIVGVFNTIVDFVKNVFDIWWNIFSTFWTTIFDFLSKVAIWVYDNVLRPVIDFFSNAFNTIWNIVQKVVNKIKGAFNAAKEAIITAFKAVKETLSNIFNTIGNIIKTPINGIINGINKVIDKINGLKVPDWVPGLGGKSPNFKKIPALATGTNYVPEDTLAMIHKGEAVVPKKFNPYANGLDNSTIGNMQANKQNIIVNVEANFETDPLGQVVRNIKTFSGGAKNDYNYGMGGSRLA
jgi:tape measure domain-containing protein